MSIEQDINRIAIALETIAAKMEGVAPAVAETPKKTKRVKETGMPAQQAVQVEGALPGTMSVDADTIPGMVEETPAANAVLVDEGPAIKTGAELRAQAQQYIAAADKVGPDMVGKLVTFIQSVAKIFNPTEPKLIKIPDAKVPEAASMIASWCAKEGIKV